MAATAAFRKPHISEFAYPSIFIEKNILIFNKTAKLDDQVFVLNSFIEQFGTPIIATQGYGQFHSLISGSKISQEWHRTVIFWINEVFRWADFGPNTTFQYSCLSCSYTFNSIYHFLRRRFVFIQGIENPEIQRLDLNPRSFFIDRKGDTVLGGRRSLISGTSLGFKKFKRTKGYSNATHSNQNEVNSWKVCRSRHAAEIAIRVGFGPACLVWGLLLLAVAIWTIGDRKHRIRGELCMWGGWVFLILSFAAICLPTYYNCDDYDNNSRTSSDLQHSNTVPHKYLLTSDNYWGTVIGIGRTQMPNILPMEKKVAVISALAEGSSIRSIERITGVHRDTIMRLGVRVGNGCAELLNAKMQNLHCHQLQFDEIWGFIGKKERHLRPEDDQNLGDVWTFCAIDPDTKIVPSFQVGKRNSATANAFVADVASRMANRVQISSDALREYVDAIELSFGSEVDFAQIIKTYTHDDSIIAERKFSAPEVVTTEKRRVSGFPNMHLASTSHIERLNGTTRLHMRRLTRLTYAFSKKLENFEAATALHFAYYNFVKRHNTLRTTPAMAAGIERDFWTVSDLVREAA